MEQSPTNQSKKDLAASKNAEPQKNAVVYFPKTKKPSFSSLKKGMAKGLGGFKRFKPIFFAVLISTIFASIAFSVIEPKLPSSDQPALVEQSKPAAGEEPVETVTSTTTAEATTIPAFSMWVVQAGVFSEIATAEASYRSLSAKMPAIQTSHEDLFALWVGAAPNETDAKAIAEKNGTQEIPLYVKQVSRPPVEIALTENDAMWLQGVNEFVLAQLASPEPLAVPENLIATAPQNELLKPVFKPIEKLQAAGIEAGTDRDTAFLQVVEGLWEISAKNN